MNTSTDTEEIHLQMSNANTYFISSQRLGMLESQIAALASTPNKRKRAVEFNRIKQVLHALKAIPSDCKIVGLAYGCIDTGDAGLFALCTSPVQLLGAMPATVEAPKDA